MANLIEGLIEQMNRCRELIKHYEAIGPVGTFGKVMIQQDIKNAEIALGSGDTIEMVKCYETLKGCE